MKTCLKHPETIIRVRVFSIILFLRVSGSEKCSTRSFKCWKICIVGICSW